MKVAIIGAGATGLAAAWTLAKNGHRVDIYETSKGELGGIAGAMPIGKTRIDKIYHHIFTSDTSILDLIDEVGLSSEMMWIEPKNGMHINGKLYPFTSPMDLILFPAVNLVSRFRMGLAVLRAQTVSDYKSMEDITAKEWLVKKAGQESYDKLWKTLLTSKFDKDADKVSGVWIWNKFKLRGSTRKSINKESLGYLMGGFFEFYKKLAELVEEKNGRIVYKKATRISGDGGKIRIDTENGTQSYDKCLFTPSPSSLAKLCTLPPDYLKKIAKIKHKANVCLTLVATKKVSDYYWVTIAEEDSPFVVFIEHTNLIKDERYEGKTIIYLSKYLDQSDPFFVASDREIKKSFLGYLPKLFPSFSESDVFETHIYRCLDSQPVVGLRYSEVVLPLETPVKNLYMASMCQIYPEDRGQNYAVVSGIAAAEAMAK
ncbi:MAG: NAD(P)/FAD-dependent oxidoreductase [Clostridiales bacterium]|jgi:protoporphyrinogen oxidase|nr:NAD(P)/FAD-dependent oxidoreductase [Clostridiales bacterium]